MEEICGSPFQTLLFYFILFVFFFHYFLNSNWQHEKELPRRPLL